ncbi:isoleucine--tRNA ligase [Candidatus Saccharibacteria bacterium]|nr:isoleucine--tRNA ligase [Candidatus Saccharibacteria bacterium]
MKKLSPYNTREVEEKMLEFWQQEDIFAKTLKKTESGKRFSFYDGPPFANGLPHFGHSLVTSIKDSIGRYQTMRGRYVERRNGWDCHGLPVEFEIEKKFGVSGKKQIMELGLEKFNQACRDSVFTYKKDWEDFFDRIGRWTDKENAYATIDNSYTESVWWVFSEIYKKDLIYKGYKSMPYCPRCATPLSNFEVNEGYKDGVTDPSLFVKFKLVDDSAYFLAWTTTPWSLPGNVALAVEPNAKYVKVKLYDDEGNNEELILAEKRLEALNSETYEVLDRYMGKDLVGKGYEPVFNLEELPKNDNLYKVWAAEFVSVEDGTGVLHVAPAFGEDDLNLGLEHGLPVLTTVDSAGLVSESVGDKEIGGLFFKKADPVIIEHLTKKGMVYAAEEQAHTYPFCYRCETPLLYYAIDTWFIAVSKLKEELLKSSESIEWVPGHIKEGRFGKWLEGARDWAISRNRYWGAPMPVWVNDDDKEDFLVISSIDELKKLALGNPEFTDLHRPHIDDVVIQKDGKTYHRVEEVIDCWFESGSMPYAQVHYPFENKDEFKESFPADYIGEGLDQTRLWFYVLHVIATILFNKPAYKNVLVNGMVMAADGQKLSKRLKNYPPLDEVFSTEGADSLRFYLLSSTPAVTGDYMRFDRSALKDIHRNLVMTLANSASFFSMYAEIDGWKPSNLDRPSKLDNPLDKWLVARVQQTVELSTKAADNFELAKASWPVYGLVEDMSNWYVRRSRRRFWKSQNDADKNQAYQTLYWSLVKICQLLAPWTPFASDYFYRHLVSDLSDAPESVHLCDWPESGTVDNKMLEEMKLVRQTVNDGLSVRAEAGIKVRQPLSNATINSPQDISAQLQALIGEELNVKDVIVKKATELKVELDTNITRELKNEGLARDIIRNIQQARKEAGLDVDNRIKLNLATQSEPLLAAIKQCAQLISAETLANELTTDPAIDLEFSKTATIDSGEIQIRLSQDEKIQ